MPGNPLKELIRYGQSFWYDNISREIIDSGELKRMIEEEGLRGVTSNPSIFYKAIKSTNAYDDELLRIINQSPDIDNKTLFFELAIKDIKDACNLLLPVYEESDGEDGFVSIEVDPHLAYDTQGTIREALSLTEKIGMPNLMIKVPATVEGLPAIEELIYLGKNINVTLLFSVERYEAVIDAYLRGLERRLADGKPLDTVNSVASFFVSRVDTMVDRMLEEMAEKAKDDEEISRIKALMGRTAVANAQIAYQSFKKLFGSDRFLKLRREKARLQRLLFGSTSTKNPAYSDILYVQELIGPGTVNTMPDATWRAFKEHGNPGRTIDLNPDQAFRTVEEVKNLGIDLASITDTLEKDGVKQFADAFDSLIELIEEKRKTFTTEKV
ncbi:MAG: transaldolase [Nitrospirae bacterium]|nr:MAG: transaldolase [Nitrospirota bacterium]